MSDSCRNLTQKKKVEQLRVSCNDLPMPPWSNDSPVAPAGQRLGWVAIGKLLACQLAPSGKLSLPLEPCAFSLASNGPNQ